MIKEKQFDELNAKTAKASAIVVRNGAKLTIDTEELVVGDILMLETGKEIPADCILIDASNL